MRGRRFGDPAGAADRTRDFRRGRTFGDRAVGAGRAPNRSWLEGQLVELGVAFLGHGEPDRERELVVSWNLRAAGGRAVPGGGGGRTRFCGSRLLLGPADHAVAPVSIVGGCCARAFSQGTGLAARTVSRAEALSPLVS